jgi:hypothetical protein
MDHDEFLKRLEAARTLSALQRLEAVEMLATNVDLRHENGQALMRARARTLREGHRVDAELDGIQPPDPASPPSRPEAGAHSADVEDPPDGS